MSKERTFIMVKPDGVQRGVVGQVISRFQRKGFKLVGLKFVEATQEQMESHYKEHKGKDFFPRIVGNMLKGPVCQMVFEGDFIVATSRKIIGATDPVQAEIGTIRGDFCGAKGKNIIHGSDSVESANREINLWFKPGEIHDFVDHHETWIYENVSKADVTSQPQELSKCPN